MAEKYINTTRYRPLWDVTIAGMPRCPECCHLYGTVYQRGRTGNTQNGRSALPIANLVADSESGSPNSYSSFLVTICLSRFVSETFEDRWTDRQTDHYYSWSPHCGGPSNKSQRNLLKAASTPREKSGPTSYTP